MPNHSEILSIREQLLQLPQLEAQGKALFKSIDRALMDVQVYQARIATFEQEIEKQNRSRVGASLKKQQRIQQTHWDFRQKLEQAERVLEQLQAQLLQLATQRQQAKQQYTEHAAAILAQRERWLQQGSGGDARWDALEQKWQNYLLQTQRDAIVDALDYMKRHAIILPNEIGSVYLLWGHETEVWHGMTKRIVDTKHFDRWYRPRYAKTVLRRIGEMKADAAQLGILLRHTGVDTTQQLEQIHKSFRIMEQTVYISERLTHDMRIRQYVKQLEEILKQSEIISRELKATKKSIEQQMQSSPKKRPQISGI
ncbi:hypothetical protein LJC55_00290 [Eubacteriales bacterium OttesenSCG-928-N14]|nr:hypothetical protein [Eubacteriales bacterium OttesenSCG-928-N14]